MIALNVLVVDDSSLAIKKMEAMLLKMGHYVRHTAKSGAEAVTKYRYEIHDLVTMDITMPDMDGIETLKKLIEIDSCAKIAMVTAMGQQSLVIEALKSGAKDFVVKPFNAERVLAAVKKIVG